MAGLLTSRIQGDCMFERLLETMTRSLQELLIMTVARDLAGQEGATPPYVSHKAFLPGKSNRVGWGWVSQPPKVFLLQFLTYIGH